MKRIILGVILLAFNSVTFSRALIDNDVLAFIRQKSMLNDSKNQVNNPNSIAVIIFLKSKSNVSSFISTLNQVPGITVKPLNFMPAVIAILPKDYKIIEKIANNQMVTQISSSKAGTEEIEISSQAILLAPSSAYPNINNFWANGYTGQSGIIGLIDSGVDTTHPGLAGKRFIIDKEANSEFDNYKNGVRTAHGTGVACIYAGVGSEPFSQDRGIAHDASIIISGLAGEGNGDTKDLLLTASTLDWMLNRATLRPTVINYSFGNGAVSCSTCTDWSGLAKMVDYVINKEKIMWVKSSGNQGLPQSNHESTMTSPADNFNGLTVANMNPTIISDGIAEQTPNRALHSIRFNSSRGPTMNGRRKPDITAPGNDTRTCAPDPKVYPLNYKTSMDYHDGYRLMGGTSSAAPHVGAAVVLLHDVGIEDPMEAKALLINSADAWTDSNRPGPNDPNHPYTGGHYQIMGSEWNATYGWGYLNMQQAFNQRANRLTGELSLDENTKEYDIFLPVGGKVTLVHERRVGYLDNGYEWRLSPLTLQLYNADTQQLIMEDSSAIDTVHQVANCLQRDDKKHCSDETKPIHALIRVKLQSNYIDGNQTEPFALAFG